MTTVGYGDFFPVSKPAKLVGVVCMFYGVYIVSLGVNTMTNLVEMDEANERAYSLVNIVRTRANIVNDSVRMVQSVFRYKQLKKKYPSSKF